MQGLRALRVGVRLDSPETEALSVADIDGAVREMTGSRSRPRVYEAATARTVEASSPSAVHA